LLYALDLLIGSYAQSAVKVVVVEDEEESIRTLENKGRGGSFTTS
jgi:hypothetical protein